MASLEEHDLNPNRWLIAITVMLAAILELLDTTIVTVSLPQMMGALGANIDEITWVLTSYIVAAAIVMPLTGFLVKTLGSRTLLLANILGFMICSILCGLSTNLIEIVFFRCLQGIFGASLVPLSQFILRDTFSKKELGVAMAIWGMGIMAAPILGPTLGGFITEHLTWRWVFYINLPVCCIAYGMAMRLIPETKKEPQHLDWLSLALMILAIGSLQILLDRGNTVNWFAAASSRWLAAGFLIGLTAFIWRSNIINNPLVSLHLFKDRNFALSTILMMLFVMAMLGQIALSPLMLQNLLGYPAITAGYAMAPRGISSMIAMAITGRLVGRIDPRMLITSGIFCSCTGTYLLAHLNLDMGYVTYFWGACLQGFGMGFFIVPVASLSLANLKPHEVAGGAGLFALSRNLGQSMGISIMTTLLARMTQTNWNTLSGYIQPFNQNFIAWQYQTHQSVHNPMTLQILAQKIAAQAQMIAFNDMAWIAGFTLLITLPFIFMLQKPNYLLNPMHSEIH